MSLHFYPNIRPALPDDYVPVSRLIVQAMGNLACTFSNSDNPAKAIPLFEYFFQKKSNQYSFENTFVYVHNKKIIGSIIGYDGSSLKIFRTPFLSYISEHYGVKDLKIEDETSAGEFYIDTLSVFPEYQGKGIGSQLISALCSNAKANKHRKMGLLVSEKNQMAKNLYERMGFKVLGKQNLIGGMYEHLQLDLNN